MRERLIEEEEEEKVDKGTKKLGASALLSSNDLWEAEVSPQPWRRLSIYVTELKALI